MKLRHHKLRLPTRSGRTSRPESAQNDQAGRRVSETSIADLLAMQPSPANTDFDPPRSAIVLRSVDF
jgi:hypothetical protein